MKNPLLAFDCSSYMWRAFGGGKDTENGYTVTHEGKEVLVNTAEYAYDIITGMMVKVMKEYGAVPMNVLLVFEGLNSKSQRILINNQYKAGGSSRPAEAYAEFNKLKEMLQENWLGLGAQVLIQDYAEGDDTLAYLACHTERDMVIASYDGDLTALNCKNGYGATVETYNDGLKAYNKYGVFDYHLVTTYKALVGDPSDNIKGCPGFGVKSFEKFLAQYGADGLQETHDLLLQSNLDPLHDMIDDPAHKLVKMIYENRVAVINSFDLAKLRPEWVNTMRVPLAHKAGMVRQRQANDDPVLRHWYGQIRLVTAENFAEACEWALPLIKACDWVSLDIETSTPDESDEWLVEQGKKEGVGVDVFGSYLCGMALTFGPNRQYTLYFSVCHANTENVSSETLRQFVAEIPQEVELVIQNVSFELVVLFNEWGARQMDNGYHGFLPNVLDTKIEANYVNENMSVGLKERSLHHLGYTQETYQQVTTITAHLGQLPKGGRYITEVYETQEVGTGKFEVILQFDAETNFPLPPLQGPEITKFVTVMRDTEEVDEAGKVVQEAVVLTQTRQYKMHELSAQHVLAYGADDTITTAALHNYYKLCMQLEHHYHVYLQVEIDAAYQHAKNFIDGCDISVEKINELAAEDTITYDKAWDVVRGYLMEKGWEGTHPPVFTKDITPAEIKVAYTIVTGEVLDTAMRTVSKIVTFIEKVKEQPAFAGLLERLAAGTDTDFNDYVQSFYKCEPQFNDGSPKQMQNLMYDVMKLTVQVRNKPTDIMRAKGEKGSAKTDALAIAYAIQECNEKVQHAEEMATDESAEVIATWSKVKDVLESLKLMAMVGTRRSLYYSKYPYFKHWKDGKVRSQHNQASTNTRRASTSGPNLQQQPKHAKIDGQDAKFREAMVPHRPDAVLVSMDFASQELRVIADYSQDPNMLACYVGDSRKDMHALTAVGIVKRMHPELGWGYDTLMKALHGELGEEAKKIAKDARTLAKKTNFTSEYGSMAPKLAQTLMVDEDTAQSFLDAKEAAFSVAAEWKEQVIEEAKTYGCVKTKLGAVRHLREALVDGDRWTASKAERQAVNFKVQSSSAEMTKLAEGRMWQAGLAYRYDAVYVGPIHDEVLWSVKVADLLDFIPDCHACMVAPYGGMHVPIESSISFGRDFYNQIEVGDLPTTEAIKAGLAELGAEHITESLGIPDSTLNTWQLVNSQVHLQITGTEAQLANLVTLLDTGADAWSFLEAEEKEIEPGKYQLNLKAECLSRTLLQQLEVCAR
jgi:DNA polymerase I-like protein with 3'-5' exonuclease and polymerase domains/5'-3' exonuclease